MLTKSAGPSMDDPEDDDEGRFFGGGLNSEQNVSFGGAEVEATQLTTANLGHFRQSRRRGRGELTDSLVPYMRL